eukprot:TRINITY_DN11062_c0_g1_i1.p1 TRINITY_DN11062_c0_g1~~TRINITY_DN11062_c0_g1_i1.p1  ORF type:complete len:173 (+),score=27.62 TRINITY_DN11062_c0_g1_i1:20-538(+)
MSDQQEPSWIIKKSPSLEDVDAINALESVCFPEDEAASLETIKYRIEHAGDYFFLCIDESDPTPLIGMVNGTLTDANELTHDSMTHHVDGGRTYCIHSVSVRPDKRRQKIATKMLCRVIEMIKEENKIDLILLMCKQYLISFYQECGFTLLGESHVEHGQDQWYEMSLNLTE